MEAFRSLQSYWRRRSYERIKNSPATKSKSVVSLGGGGKRWRRSVKVRPVIKLKQMYVPTPRKVMAKLRDAYMDAMLLLSGGGGGAATNKIGGGGGGGQIWDRRIPRERRASLSGGDFEKKIMLHLYSSVIATR